MYKRLISNIVLLFITASMVAQTYKEEKQVVRSNSLDSKEEQLNYVNNNLINSGLLQQRRNSVFIEQVGQGNVGVIAISSDNSEVNLFQDGFENKSFIFLKADVIRQNVQQIGNQNLFLDYSLHGAKSHTVDLKQNGNYNEVISVGKNSISERLQLNQTGVGKRAFIIHN